METISIAEAMISGEIPLIDGARLLCNLRYQIGAIDDSLFTPIVGFESQTDEYPDESRRSLYSKKYLAELDKEILPWVEEVRPGIIADCKEIIAAMKSQSAND